MKGIILIHALTSKLSPLRAYYQSMILHVIFLKWNADTNAASFQTSTCVQHLQHHDKHNPSSFTVQERKELRIVPLVHELLTPSNTVQTYTSISVTADIIEGWIFHQNLHANFFFSPILWLCFLLQHSSLFLFLWHSKSITIIPSSFPLHIPHILQWYTSYEHYTEF